MKRHALISYKITMELLRAISRQYSAKWELLAIKTSKPEAWWDIEKSNPEILRTPLRKPGAEWEDVEKPAFHFDSGVGEYTLHYHDWICWALACYQYMDDNVISRIKDICT